MLPQLFHIGRFSLATYGVLAAVGLLTGLWVIVWCARRQGMDEEKTWNLGVLAILSAIVGAKLLLIAIDARYYAAHPGEIFSLGTLQAGGVYEGGLVVGLLASYWYIRRNRMAVLATCDVFAPGVALGHGIGRLGCFAAGCCFGKPTDLPWGVTFTNPLANFINQTPLGIP
ncbi:MAG TPA: prolipoprotein diacylglyceryl transferase family protein, partial [Terriglobales bacterium]|nr:prolipoprotein diacylglyceryl transferase family protein [Terriglobales bacterium]